MEAERRSPDCPRARRKRRGALRIVREPDGARSCRAALPTSQEKQDRAYSSSIRTDGKQDSAILAAPELSAKKNMPFLQFPERRERRFVLFLAADKPDGRRIALFLTKHTSVSLENSHFLLTFAAVPSGKRSQVKEPYHVHSIYRNYSFSEIGKILIVVE